MSIPLIDVTVIIVAYQSDTCLRAVVQSLASGRPQSLELLVINNDSALPIQAALPKSVNFEGCCSITNNGTNIGFGAACNQAALGARGEFLFILNPDCVVTANTIATLVEAALSTPDLGCAGPKVVNADGSLQGSARAFPSFRTALFGRTSFLSKLFPQNPFSRGEVCDGSAGQGDSPVAVDWVSGAAMLVPRRLFEQVGGFDGRFFMYWEDADLCLRLAQAGYKTYYVPSAVVEHRQGSCSRSAIWRTSVEFHKSVYRYYLKNINPNAGLLKRLFIGGGLTARTLLHAATRAAKRSLGR